MPVRRWLTVIMASPVNRIALLVLLGCGTISRDFPGESAKVTDIIQSV